MSELMYSAETHIDPEIRANPAIVGSVKNASPIHYHDFYEFFLITKGSCIHKVNNQEQNLVEGELIFIRPEDRHYYECYSDIDCQFINMACDREIIEDAFIYFKNTPWEKRLLSEKLPPRTLLLPMGMESFINQYEKLTVLATINKPQARQKVRSMVIEILVYFFSESQNVNNKNIPLWLESLLTQMHRKENFTQGLKKMYTLSGRSVGHLNRIFKKYFNTTPTAYINNLRLNYAKSLLLTTELSIIDVALEAGFENLSHFYHLFKKHFNITPLKVRGNYSFSQSYLNDMNIKKI